MAAAVPVQALRRVRAMLKLPVGPPPQRLFPQCKSCSVKQVLLECCAAGTLHTSGCNACLRCIGTASTRVHHCECTVCKLQVAAALLCIHLAPDQAVSRGVG